MSLIVDFVFDTPGGWHLNAETCSIYLNLCIPCNPIVRICR